MPATYPTEFKIKAIRRYQKGESIKSLSEELHISQSTLYILVLCGCSTCLIASSWAPWTLDKK